MDRMTLCSRSRWHGLLAAGVLCAAPVSVAQEAAVLKKPVVVVLGASVSAGFVDNFVTRRADGEPNRSMRMAAALKILWPDGGVQLRDQADLLMFMDPVVRGKRQVKRGQRVPADLVIGIDFMFWFGYGTAFTVGDEQEARFKLQSQAFEMLESFDCPLILGDYPDMLDADKRMIPGAAMPEPDTLKELNRRLYQWASERDKVNVFPLARWGESAKKGEYSIRWKGRDLVVPIEKMLQSDRLHATKLGLVLLLHKLQSSVAVVLPQDHPLCATKRTAEQLIEVARLADELQPAEKDAVKDAGANIIRSGAGK